VNGQADFDKAALNYNLMADTYEASRPGYQSNVIDRVLERFAVAKGDKVVDLAAGTGKFTREITESWAQVIAVEPVAAMAQTLAEAVPGANVIRAYAGQLPLADGSIAAMSVAQAFQWFTADDVEEMARVLASEAVLALVWNRRQPEGLWREINEVISHYRPQKRRQVDATAMLAASARFEDCEIERTPWKRTLSRDELFGHMRSLSWVAVLDAERKDQMLGAIAELATGSRPFELAYESEIIFTRRL
jgi:ubiquinone/menaquinone biosynthesis C-methylase UbiE